MTGNHPAAWDRASPHDAAKWFASTRVRWWIAGGWAIDLFLDRETRPHDDLDVGLLRRDVAEVLGSLPDWEAFEAKDGALTLLTQAPPRKEVNSLWCRGLGRQPWKLELMLDESAGDSWVYRRDPRVRRSLDSLVCRSSMGIPYLAPEIQLLYKAKHVRPKDEQDFAAAIPRLGADARSWLRQSLVLTLGSHPWIHAIERCRDQA